MNDNQNSLTELRTELAGLRVRLRRIEEFFSAYPGADEYFPLPEFKSTVASDLQQELKNQISEVKLRIHHIEDFIKELPSGSDFVTDEHTYDPIEEPLYEDAKNLLVAHEKVSASLLQRRLSIGYARACRILEMMEKDGLVSHEDGSEPREVLTPNNKDTKS